MRLKLAGTLVAALLVFGMVFGVGQAAAESLPGGPLYGLKLTAEEARMALTSDPEAKAELAAEFAENRLDEIGRMMAAGKAVDGETAHRAQQQVSQAYQYMNQIEGEGQGEVAQQLGTMLQSRNRVMEDEIKGVPRQQQEPLRTLLRSMEVVRNRVSEGQGSMNRNQEGDPVPPEREELPDPANQPGAGPQAGQQDDGLLDAAGDTGQGGQGQGAMGPSDGENPGQGPAGQQNGGEVDPDQNQYGPSGPQGGYEGDGPSHGPESTDPTQGPEAKFTWWWNLFRKNPESSGSSSGSGSSGSGSSGSGSSGSGSSGSGSSGSGSSGSGSSGNGSSGNGSSAGQN